MSVMPSNNNGFYLEHTTASAGDFTALLKTENKFVDQDIGIKIKHGHISIARIAKPFL